MGSDGAFGDGYGSSRSVRTEKPRTSVRGVVTLESTNLPGLVAWGLFSGLLLMVAGGILLSREVARPLQAVLEGMQALQEGKGAVRVSTVAWDELADLTSGFNSLAQALEVERQRNLELYRNTVRTLAAAIDARDPYTRGHSQRVGAYAQLIALRLGWDSEKAYQLYITGLLHDKIGVPEAVLKKTSRLSAKERQLIESHPLIGYEIVRQPRAYGASGRHSASPRAAGWQRLP